MAKDTVDILIDSLKAAGVKYVFGVPGAKIDSVFNALIDHPDIKLVVCRHEQNAAFIAAAMGKVTGIPGVCIATSGPGTSNLVTGLVTATDEGAPVVAIVGSVRRAQSLQRTHQSLRGVDLLAPVTKKAVSAVVEDQIAEIMLDAFRVAATSPRGATAISLPIDLMTPVKSTSEVMAFPKASFIPPTYGKSPEATLQAAADLISAAKAPVLFLGMRVSESDDTINAIHSFLKKHPVPVVETFQAAGAISKDLVHLFYGRIGLFRNQPGDKLLQHADLVIAVGLDQAEYDANLWNARNTTILHMDVASADFVGNYVPKVELIGSIADNIAELNGRLDTVARLQLTEAGEAIQTSMLEWVKSPEAVGRPTGPIHPLHFIRLFQNMIKPSTTVISDVGSVYIWLCRYFYSYKPRTFLMSNVQQTLGVALPWAIGVSLSQTPPSSEKVISISGDGGFMFSSQELVTAVQQGCNITHFVWNDGKYNMVEFQEVDKYGRSSGVELGGVDFVKLADAMGAKGLRVTSSGDLEAVMKEALEYVGVCIVEIEIDYSQNHNLMLNLVTSDVM
ncbi:acetolactate synthase [Aaosphaeria arxii CBS 175.79]|uniref:Acetolactate synthase n=1 Tax=Aaosphaeria arxii CBS 175.79 TaxID=1450172 RepID=A0A6A5XX04_9PLEO|nr:acetolactate synthase [Aaosphaeria arxii CBS 175.79]KAF2017692.1 acetolactate synthase [Aaosphaeria arxii CBS 175.79]